MGWMRKYLAGFRMALSRELIYRTDFLFGRVRHLLVFAGLLYFFSALPQGAGDYDPQRLLTYILAASFMTGFMLVGEMDAIANEIADGDLTNYLLRPMHYLWFWAVRVLAKRTVRIFTGVLELVILLALFSPHSFFIQDRWWYLFQTLVFVLVGMVIVQLVDFLAASLSFWTERSFGPRWLTTVLWRFFSGSFLPVDLLNPLLAKILFFTPFPYVIYAPIKAYLGDLSLEAFLQILLIQCVWVGALLFALVFIWKKGTQSYEAYGR